VAQEFFPRKDDFSIPEGITYLNGAYMHPMPNKVRDAVRDYNDRRGGFTTQTSADPDLDNRVKAENKSPIKHKVVFDLGEATELEVETNGEGKKCGEHKFNVSLKSTQGHELLPAEGGVEKRVAATSPPYHLQPAFSEAEIDDVAEKHRKEYHAGKHQGGELEEEGKAKKLKVRDALIQLENLPKTDGEWIRGEIRKLDRWRKSSRLRR
jgi:hypothetical protein